MNSGLSPDFSVLLKVSLSEKLSKRLSKSEVTDWLPDFKVATLSGDLLSYLADDCHFIGHAHERQLRSTESRACIVTWTYSTFGDESFLQLLLVLRDTVLSYSRFRRSLKTFLFG